MATADDLSLSKEAVTPAVSGAESDSASTSMGTIAPLPAAPGPQQQQQQQQRRPDPDQSRDHNSDPESDPESHRRISQGGPRSQSFGARPACFTSTLQECLFVFQATTATATSSFFLGASAILTASIGRDLGMTQGEISWITASTSLTAGAFQLGLGQSADLLGRRAQFVAGMASFAAFALLVAFAQNPFWMDVVCGLLGLCAAMVVPPAIGIMGAAYDVPSKRKNLAFSAFSAGNPLGFVLGSVISGVAAMVLNWRASYVLMAILWVVFAVGALWTIPKVEAYPPGEPFRERLARFVRTFDFVGTALTILGTGLLTAGIT
jgi:MFS family permease